MSHVRLYQKLIPEAMKIFPHSVDQINELADTVATQEIAWSTHIIGKDILGMPPESVEQYVKYLTNSRLKAIGLLPIYEGDPKSPFAHLEKFSDTKKEGHTKANFFEATVTSYSMSSGIPGWDEI